MLTMTQVQIPAADLRPDDVVVYWTASHGVQPRLPAPSPDHEAVTPAVIVALYADGGRAEPMAMWARVFRLRPEVRAEREKAAEHEALRAEVLSVTRALFPGFDDDGWWIADRHRSNGWKADSAANITLIDDPNGECLRCIWGPLDSDRVVMNGSWAEVRERVIATLTAYLANKTTREGTSARIVERRDRAQALLAAMGVVDPDAGEG